MWTFTWGVETTALYSASLHDDKKDSKQEKRAFLLVNSNSDSHVNSTSHVDLDMRFWDEKIKLAWIFRHIYSIICELVTIKFAKIWALYGYLFYGMSKLFTLGCALLSPLPKLISRCFHKILKLFYFFYYVFFIKSHTCHIMTLYVNQFLFYGKVPANFKMPLFLVCLWAIDRTSHMLILFAVLVSLFELLREWLVFLKIGVGT